MEVGEEEEEDKRKVGGGYRNDGKRKISNFPVMPGACVYNRAAPM